MSKKREDVALNDQWDVATLYKNLDEWETHLNSIKGEASRPRWPEIQKFKGSLGKNSETLKQLLQIVLKLDENLSDLYVYAHLRQDEDLANNKHKAINQQIASLAQDFSQEISWIDPELLNLPENTIQSYLKDADLKELHFYIENIVRMKKHTLSPEQEELIALGSKSLSAAHNAFSSINNADFKFGTITDGSNTSHELTHASYGLYLKDQDRTLRKNAFTTLHKKFHSYENTICELLKGAVEGHVFNARARKYSCCLEASLYPKNINPEVYKSLITSVHKNIGSLHRYVKLIKKVLDVDTLHLYDMSVPLIKNVDINMPYQEAVDIIVDSVEPLGQQYQDILKKGLNEDRWVDRYENENKRSGAYSSGSHNSKPYILMNYKSILRDVFTLAHEAGHSMHSFLSHKNQPYQYSNYTIFVAEVASTFNEELLMQKLMKTRQSPEEKIYLIHQKIQDIHGTLFRQAMFAEFELWLHETAEKGAPFTPLTLREKYLELSRFYFGDAMTFDDVAGVEWARIPHFYYNFYVYQYATGISAALALCDRVVAGGEKERNDYLSFLQGGSSKYPIDLLLQAGVDMRTSEPIEATTAKFDSLVNQLDELLSSTSCKS